MRQRRRLRAMTNEELGHHVKKRRGSLGLRAAAIRAMRSEK
jgi:hypothetical protein